MDARTHGRTDARNHAPSRVDAIERNAFEVGGEALGEEHAASVMLTVEHEPVVCLGVDVTRVHALGDDGNVQLARVHASRHEVDDPCRLGVLEAFRQLIPTHEIGREPGLQIC